MIAFLVALSMLFLVVPCISPTVVAQPVAALLPPSNEYVQDTDSDGLFDFLVIEVTFEVYEAGSYMVGVELNDSAGHVIHSVGSGAAFAAGTYVVPLSIEGIKIWANGADGPYVVLADLHTYPWALVDEYTDVTDPYTFDQFEHLPAMFDIVTGSSGLDTDGNGRDEFLVTSFSVDIFEANDYQIICQLMKSVNSSWVDIGEVREWHYLDVGAQAMSIAVRGSLINAARLDGPYYILLWMSDYVGHTRSLDDIWYVTDSYRYAEFEAGSFTSKWSLSQPVIDGVFGPNEWQDATIIDIGNPDRENPLDAAMFVKNNLTHIYICVDVAGDESADMGDSASIAFDTGNDNTAGVGGEDQFVVGPMPGQSVHKTYSADVSDWIVDCEPFDPGLPNHGGIAASVGFGTSRDSAVNHRIYEFALPLGLIGADVGDVVGFATNSNSSLGIFDATINNGSSWPYFMGANASLANYGDLTIGWPPINTTATISGTLGESDWYISPVNVTLSASNGLLGIARTEYLLDLNSWNTYMLPVECVSEGSHNLSYRSYDLKGNSEELRYLTFKLDLTAPWTVSSLSGRNVTLNATDVASGIDRTYFRIDGGSWQNYTSPIEVLGDIDHSVEFYSVDVAGNTEDTKTLSVEKEVEGGGGGLGFTFWIALASIAIIVCIAIPTIFGMRRKAKESDAKAAVKDIGTAVTQYSDISSGKEKPPRPGE
jgi:hypothetical protein